MIEHINPKLSAKRQKPISRIPAKPCKWCKEKQPKHYAFQCKLNPRNQVRLQPSTRPLKRVKTIRPESYKSKQKREATSVLWFELNPPDSKGYWYCYLRISPNCLYKLDRRDVTLEHVRPKARAPELKYEVTNLKAACANCNGLKLTQDLEDLVDEFPHLQQYIDAIA